MKRKNQISETFFLGAILAVVGGYLDAYTYISRGNVFANAQTGNIVLLGINLAKLNFAGALLYLVPIVFFFIGVLMAEFIKSKEQAIFLHWRQAIILIECVVLTLVAFIPSKYNIFANIFISFVCALQVESFRKVKGHTYASTMCTGNLRSGTESLFTYITTKEKHYLRKTIRYFGIIAFFVIGALVGTLITYALSIKSVLFCSLPLIIVFIAMFKEKE